MIRALVCDDSAAARELIVAILESDPGIRVVGRATNGVEAIHLNAQLSPDVITMDIEMPVMDGLEATRRIMSQQPIPIVIITSTAARGEHQQLSLEATRHGALLVLAKPAGPASPDFLRDSTELIEMVKAMATVRVVKHRQSIRETAQMSADRAIPSPTPRPDISHGGGPGAAARNHRPPPAILSIGGSTGAPGALHTILSALPRDFPAPIAIVQHMAAGFIGALAQWLDASTPLRVSLARHGDPLVPGSVLIAPDDVHLEIASDRTVALRASPPVNGFRPSATTLFASVAKTYGAAAGALILTGMGNDGVEGLRAVHRAGGYIAAQDEATSVVYGMPYEAARAGVVTDVLPLQAIAARMAAIYTL